MLVRRFRMLWLSIDLPALDVRITEAIDLFLDSLVLRMLRNLPSTGSSSIE